MLTHRCDKTDMLQNNSNDLEQQSQGDLRVLTQAEREKLEKDTALVSSFKQAKLEKEAQRNWDIFYKRNTTKFFKDRHWTTREFKELCDAKGTGEVVKVLEVGCGVGNFIFPLIEEDQSMFFYACDFSPRAVQFVKENPLYSPDRCLAFQCDVTKDDLTMTITVPDVDISTLLFVLSAVHPDKMLLALQNIYQVMKPGGCVLVRDYGLYDHAMLRFAPGHKLSDNFYVRQDGTRAYYFTIEFMKELFEGAGFSTKSCDYVHRKTVNKKEGIDVPRVFVQGRFSKDSSDGYFNSSLKPTNISSASSCEENEPDFVHTKRHIDTQTSIDSPANREVTRMAELMLSSDACITHAQDDRQQKIDSKQTESQESKDSVQTNSQDNIIDQNMQQT